MDKKQSKIKYSDLWGLREEKYKFLETHDIENTEWQAVKPREPYYFFVPKEEQGREKYDRFWRITDIFPVNSTGVVTARDNFVIDINKQSLEAKIRIFLDKDNSDEYIKEFLKGILGRKKPEDVENYAWRVSEARKKLKQEKDLEDCFIKILYRPFDERWICYHPAIVWRTRDNVMKHMLRTNLALVVCRQYSGNHFYHALVANGVIESCYVSNRTKEIGYVLPLYLYYTEGKQKTIFTMQDKLDIQDVQHNLRVKEIKEPNVNPKLFDCLKKHFGQRPSAEEIFYYIYAVLYSNIYRQKYQEFLKIDFPRVPFAKNYQLFQELAVLGNKLVDLHLLKSPILENLTAKFYGQDNGQMETQKYEADKKRVYINAEQYFEPVEKNVWEYLIGGYQVLGKWLKDKKGRNLSSDDIKHYCHIITALSKTVEIQKQIDKIYPEVEKDIII